MDGFDQGLVVLTVLGLWLLAIALGDELARWLPRVDRFLHRALGGDR